MPLSVGTQLGPYEIIAPLGAGGMGEVYRARDRRLGRDVAIKTLPVAFAQDPERRARFESEAKAVAALSHPNVLAIHDIGAEGDLVYAVMELVEGQTLRERLEDGPLPGQRAISFAIQIAHGLAAAHDRGVIHRDLKPENVILTPDGRAKILDFGLAKRVTQTSDGSKSLAPTLAAGTEPGVVLGTTGYMSPEQVRGLPADARSDIFALGALIHEMFSGRRAFHAASPADTMSAILREDPPDLTSLAPETSPAVERIVRRCLEKQPSGRFRSAADLAYSLEAVSSSGSSVAQGGSSSHSAVAPRQPRFQRLTYRKGVVSGARFVPDGAGVVYAASWEGDPFEIFSSRPGSPDARSLGLPSGNLLAMSSTGEMALSIGYRHHYWNQVSGTLARAALAGGTPRPLQKDVGHADWSPDGKAMAVIRYAEGRCRLEYPAGRVLFETPDWLSHPRVSRDGKRVAFACHPLFGDTGGDVCIAGESSGHRVVHPGLTSISAISWSPSGEEIWCSGIDAGQQNGIWGSTLDGARRVIHISPARVTLHDVTRDGRALIGIGNLRLCLNASGDDGTPETDLSWFDGSVAADLSSDGRQILFTEGHEAENPHYACFMRNVDGSPAVRLGEGIATRISPDGESVLAVLIRPTHGLVMYPIGLGEPRSIPIDGIDRILWAGFHPDGEHLIVVGTTSGRVRRLYRVPKTGGTPHLLWDDEIAFDHLEGLPLSPDGDRLVLRRPSGGHLMYSFRTNACEPIPGLTPDDAALNFADSGNILYVGGGAPRDYIIHRLDLESGKRTPWRLLAPPDPTGIVYAGSPIVAADGSRYAYSVFRHISDLYLVEGLG